MSNKKMTKKYMIEYLVKEWVRNGKTENERKERFTIHSTIESKLDRYWKKSGIEWAYKLYLFEGISINSIIRKFVENREL